MDANLQDKKVEVVEEAITSTIRTLLIGSSFGVTLAREITASGEHGHLIMSSAGEGQHVTKVGLYKLNAVDQQRESAW